MKKLARHFGIDAAVEAADAGTQKTPSIFIDCVALREKLGAEKDIGPPLFAGGVTPYSAFIDFSRQENEFGHLFIVFSNDSMRFFGPGMDGCDIAAFTEQFSRLPVPFHRPLAVSVNCVVGAVATSMTLTKDGIAQHAAKQRVFIMDILETGRLKAEAEAREKLAKRGSALTVRARAADQYTVPEIA